MSSSRRLSRDNSGKRNPLVRSLRAKSSSSNASSNLRKKSMDAQEVHLEAEELTDEKEKREGLTPVTLTKWILSRGQSYGSVYLVPFSQTNDDLDHHLLPSGYRYRIMGTTQPMMEKQFYTLSVTGLTSFHMGEVGFLSLDEWVAEYRNYEKLRTISFFFRFKTTKSFETWKCVVKRQKFTSASKKLAETSCIFGNSKMRHCFLQVQSLVGRLTDMGVPEILQRKTYDLDDFFTRQLHLTSDFATNFGDFRNIVCQLVLDTCKSTFSDAGFSSDEYGLELAEVERQAQKEYAGSAASSSSRSSSRSTDRERRPRPRKLTFIEQVNKRKVCENIVRFVRLVDFMLRYTSHMIVVNSLVAVHKALVSRARGRQTTSTTATASDEKEGSKEAVESDTEIPVFSCKVILVGDQITISPDLQKFEDGFHNLLNKLDESVNSVPVLFDDVVFNPFSQPILYGKMENYKEDYEQSPFIHGHDEKCNEIMVNIRNALLEAFQVCDLEMECYKATAREFSDVGKSEEANMATAGGAASRLVDVETDVDSLKSKLANLTDQQSLAKGIKDQQNMSIFRADFKPLKRTILPNISKTIIQMQDALPKLGREKMEQFNEDCKSLKDMIDFELKTSEDYVDNMDIKDKLQGRLSQLQNKLEAIENVYLIMKNIPVPVSTEDKNSLKSLKSQLKSLGGKVRDKIKSHADILERFAETLESEQLALKETVASLLQEVRSPALLELEATADEIKPTLAKIEQMLKQASAKVLQYNQYEKKYGFHITEYLELVAAEQHLASINTVWKCTEDWEHLYTKWASVEFSQLDVDDCEEGTAMIELELEEAKEIIGSSPMYLDLMAKVHATTQKLPVLKDLRTQALKERHWKQISEVVGADLTSTGKKLTLEVLEKYNVFAYDADISRIVRAATQEEQLDFMISDLRSTWTEQKIAIKMSHGIPTVCDFTHLHSIVTSSVVTLKELGQSRYSSQMKDTLLYWSDVVEKAERFVWLLSKAQELWMYQEVPMTSMLLGGKHPSKFAYFKLVRQKFNNQMNKVAGADALISAFGDQNDYYQLTDILLGFKKTEELLDSVLWSLRADSPRLFFLNRTDLLNMLFEAHNDLPAMYRYIHKIFPFMSSLLLVEGTDLTLNKTGYHPEIEGIISKDGERIVFSEIMKVRLGVEHWVKYIGIHLRFTLRSQLRALHKKHSLSGGTSLQDLSKFWETIEISTQMHLVATHVMVVNLLMANEGILTEMVATLKAMKTNTLEVLKAHGVNEIQKRRDVAKLLLLDYYLDLVSKHKTSRGVLDNLLVRYSWEEERRVISVSQLNGGTNCPYGYEYNGQHPLFDPSMASDRIAFSILTALATSASICLLQQDVRKNQLKSMCYIFGRPMFFYSAGIQDNFRESVVGAVITNAWIYICADDLDAETRPLLRTLLMKLEIAKRFREDHVEVFGQEVFLGGHANIFVARSLLLTKTTQDEIGDNEVTEMFKRFRSIGLASLPLKMKIRMGLLARGVSDKGLSLFLLIVVDRFLQLEEELGPQCIVIKMLNAIQLSISTSKMGILQKFFNQGMDAEVMRVKMNIGQLVLDDDVYDIIKRHAKMTSEFKSYFEEIRNPSMVAAATSRAMVENCILLQTSVSNFSITCAVYPQMSNTIRRTMRATETFLTNQTGCAVYEICSQTQLKVGTTLKRILRASREATGILHVYGTIDVETISLLRNIALQNPTLKVLFSCNNKIILKEITTYLNCVKLKNDPQYNFLVAMAPCLSERLFGVIDKHFKTVFPLLEDSLKVMRETMIESIRNGCQVIPTEKSLAIGVATSLAKQIGANQDVISNLLSSPDLVVTHVKTSLEETKGWFQPNFNPDTVSTAESKMEGSHPLFERKVNSEVLEPLVYVAHGHPRIYIPTQAIVATVQVLHYFLENNISIILLGARGCGKTLSLSKVVPQLSSGITVKYLLLGDSPDYAYEVNILKQLTGYKSNIIVLENFDPKNENHVHFVISLSLGRTFFDERAGKFQRLPSLTLLVESNCNMEDLPHSLTYNMVIARMAKDEKSNHEVLKQAFATVQDNLSGNISDSWQEISDLLWSWHNYICDKYPIISDHALFRSLNGIISCVPEELDSKDDLLKFVYSELLNEYCSHVPTHVIEEELRQWKPFTELMNNPEEEILFFYNQASNEEHLPLVQLKTMPDTIKKLLQTLAQIRGKQYNDRVVLSHHFTRQIVSMLRAFCRYGMVTVIGPHGCGKNSAVTFCAHMLDLEIVECNLDDFDQLFQSLKAAYTLANNENPRLIIVRLEESSNLKVFRVLDLLNKVFQYYDIPGAFDTEEKMRQLFDDDMERREALLDSKAMVEATTELGVRIKDNLHLVVTMTPQVFVEAYPRYSNLFHKSGIVRMSAWPEETLVAIAEERFLGLEKDLSMPIRNVSKICAIIHLQMMNEPVRQVTSTQYLDMVKILPLLYRPLQKKLMQIKQNLQTGIDQVHKANTYITKLTNEISEKEPEVLRLNTEIEQLNKRLSQERLNLERASKSFRKKEAAARKKSEETQELAADAHRNLEHALPSLEAAMQAVNAIDKNELNDLRSMKNPPELAQQVLEAVCILLGLKADWNAAKMVTGDPQFIQKLIDFDKDNIPDQVSKRVRRYIDNPKFIPDEVAKVSRLSSSLCMWVRAIDLYAKIFKSIEPKRIRLLQAESELAEAMAALREETDRVAHIESTITSIQSNQQERVKRKANLEASIKQTAVRLERAQLLSYSLEEESQRWKANLLEVDKNLQMLIGNSVVAAMIVAYSGGMRQNERRLMIEKWRKICDRGKLETTVIPANDFLAPIMTPLRNWIGKFEFYCQNYLSMRISNKWPLLQDPHGLAIEALKAQNENLIVVSMNDDRLADVLRQAVSKGHEVVVMNYDPSRLRPGLKAVFHRKMTERIHAFVGLMGIPIMRRDQRVHVDGQEVVCNPKFKLLLHSQNVDNEVKPRVKNVYNVIIFEYSAEALELQLLKKVMLQIDATFSKDYEETIYNIRHLEQTVVERKDNVLDILLKTEEDVLDDKSVIVSLKDAKAKVFEILNDLNLERKEMARIEEDLPRYKFISLKMRGLIKLLDLLSPCGNDSPLPVVAFMKEIEKTTTENVDEFLQLFACQITDLVLPAIPSKDRYVLQMGCNVVLGAETFTQMSNSLELFMKKLFDYQEHNGDEAAWKSFAQQTLDEYLNPVNENDAMEEALVKHQFDSYMRGNDEPYAQVLATEKSLVDRLEIMSKNRPVLLFSDTRGAFDAVDVICELARSCKTASPKYISADLMAPSQIANAIVTCKKEKRWLIIDNFNQVTNEIVETIPSTLSNHRLFLIASHGQISLSLDMQNKVAYLSLTHASNAVIRKAIYMSLLKLRLHSPSAQPFLEGILKLHEYLADCYPHSDQYRYLWVFVKKWQQRSGDLTPEDIHSLINESYDLEGTSNNNDLLQSILREISSIM